MPIDSKVSSSVKIPKTKSKSSKGKSSKGKSSKSKSSKGKSKTFTKTKNSKSTTTTNSKIKKTPSKTTVGKNNKFKKVPKIDSKGKTKKISVKFTTNPVSKNNDDYGTTKLQTKTNKKVVNNNKKKQNSKHSKPLKSSGSKSRSRSEMKIDFFSSGMKKEDKYIVEKKTNNKLVGVFDGHGGSLTSTFLSKNFSYFLNSIYTQLSEQNADAPIAYILSQTLEMMDRKLRKLVLEKYNSDESGSTACCLIVEVERKFPVRFSVVNVGDSRCVLSRNGVAKQISHDHKPGNPSEKKRIEQMNGNIMVSPGDVPRVGPLAISRTIGDFRVRESYDGRGIIPKPETFSGIITSEDEFFVIASDGLWDVMTSSEVVKYVRSLMKSGDTLKTCAKKLVHYATNVLKSDDDTTVVLFRLKPVSEFAKHISGKSISSEQNKEGGGKGEDKTSQIMRFV